MTGFMKENIIGELKYTIEGKWNIIGWINIVNMWALSKKVRTVKKEMRSKVNICISIKGRKYKSNWSFYTRPPASVTKAKI